MDFGASKNVQLDILQCFCSFFYDQQEANMSHR